MGIRIRSIGSSSSGNSYLIQGGNTNVLLDLGLSAKKIKTALSTLGVEKDSIEAVLITHEHIDHVRSVRQISKDFDKIRFYASRGTVGNTDKFDYVDDSRLTYIKAGDTFQIGDFAVKAFALSHDAAEPVGYSFECGGERLSVITDTGIVTAEIFEEMKRADKLVFESNHEKNILLMGPYPYNVKLRILSDEGHLSNVTAGEVLAEVLKAKDKKRAEASEAREVREGAEAAEVRDEAETSSAREIREGAEAAETSSACLKVMLAHLSDTNNTPYQARITVGDILQSAGYEADRDYELIVAMKEGITELI